MKLSVEQKYLKLGLFGLIAGAASFRAYEVSGTASAAVSLLIAAWILVNLMTAKNMLDGLETLLEPFHTAINFLLLGFLYAALEGKGFWPSIGIAVTAALLGAFLSMWIYKYWNIGG